MTGKHVIGLVQRVSEASVVVSGRTAAAIGNGLLVLVAVERGDGEHEADRLLERLLGFRIFEDRRGRMNLDVREAGGALLLVPQFTLVADTAKGNRPGFSGAADAEQGRALFERLTVAAAAAGIPTGRGVFGATMQVRLCNEGPATFLLRVPPPV
jgi:D-tyrosyl-tRNA(Tyr) deacylase